MSVNNNYSGEPLNRQSTRAETTQASPEVRGPGTAAGRTANKKKISPFIKSPDLIRIKGGIDRPMLIIIIILVCFGSVMVFSASYASALIRKGDSFYYIKRQILWVILGFIVMSIAMRFDYEWLRKVTLPAFIVTCFLLILVLVAGVANGQAQRWIVIPGIGFTLQPSEIMKFALVAMLALYIARNQDRITNYRNFWQSSLYGVFIPGAIVFIVCVLIALEFHFSCTIIMFLIGMCVIFLGGARKFWFAALGGGAAVVITPFILFTDYARSRLDTFLHPENADPLSEGWQSAQGLNAIGSGGLLGVGLGNSRQKHLWVSEPQNDFIFSIVCEELGFVGALAVIILFVMFIWRGFVIGLRAPDTFSSLVVLGIVSKVAIQSTLNICVVTGLIPNTGIPLPFFSYGGTSMIMLLGEMGILLSISRFSYQEK
ncbi:MAG: putative lipid II flippase FtsW [Firmicutes bacterium]|nr:putative lipid II flippase FtsW [Bacillota bacterium]